MSLAVKCNVPSLVHPILRAQGDVNMAFERAHDRTPLHRVAMRGNLSFCKLLLAAGADLARRDSNGATAVHLASYKGRLQVAEALLALDPALAAQADSIGRTPCHMAAVKGHLAVVQCLIQKRASFDARASDGRTPIDMAKSGQHQELARYLERLEDVRVVQQLAA